MEENSIDLIHTSIPFSNHYEYTPSYYDYGHNEDTARFFEQMDYLTPELLRILNPGRVAAIHVKDRVLFGNATGMGMPTMQPFHAYCISHYMKQLEHMTLLRVLCECGGRFKYQTNIQAPLFDIKCLDCGMPVSVEYHEKNQRYETIGAR